MNDYTSSEGRDSEASHEATRDMLFSRLGIGLALLGITIWLAVGATMLIAGCTR